MDEQMKTNGQNALSSKAQSKINMKAIIYCRVSTKEQAETGYSLQAQEGECRNFAYKDGYEVDKVFIERGESAKTQDRTQLRRLIEYVARNKKTLAVLIIWKFDRLTRNLSDQIELVKGFNQLGVRVLSATENNEDNSVGRLMRNIIGSISQYTNDVKSERTINGMKQAVKEGRWCWQAPVGYKNSRDDLNKPILVPSEESVFIKEAFELAESGLYKQVDIAKKLKKKGFNKITKSLVSRILTSPLYAGLIKVSWFPDYIRAVHQAIIPKETFHKVQMMLKGKKPSITPHIRNSPDFPLRNFVRCHKCSQKLTGGWSTGRKKVRYAYYHCRTKGCSLNVRKHDLEARFYDYLKTFQPNEDIWALFEAIVSDVWKAKQSERTKQRNRLEKELRALREKRGKIDELMIKNLFDEESYRRNSEEVKNEMGQRRIDLEETKAELENDMQDCLDYCKFFLSNTADLWSDAELDLKQRFQTLIFPQEVYYDRESFRTGVTALIFKHLQPKSHAESCLVSPGGLEPPLSP